MKWPKNLKCKACGKSHAGVDFTCERDCPDTYADLDEDECYWRAVIGSDQCVIDSECFFVKGILEIPIIGNDEPFTWGVWVSVDQETFNEISSIWELENQEEHGPYSGRLANNLPLYSETLDLRIRLITQPPGMRPLIVVDEAHHILGMQQKTGITQDEAVEFATFLLHSAGCQAGCT